MVGHLGPLLTTLIVIASAVNLYTPVHDWLAGRFSLAPQHLCLDALLIVILAPLVVVLIIGQMAGTMLKLTLVRWADRLAGAVCGFVSSSAFVALTFIVVNLPPEPMRPPGMGKDSWIGAHIVGVESQLQERVQSRVKTARDDLRKAHESRVVGHGESWGE